MRALGVASCQVAVMESLQHPSILQFIEHTEDQAPLCAATTAPATPHRCHLGAVTSRPPERAERLTAPEACDLRCTRACVSALTLSWHPQDNHYVIMELATNGDLFDMLIDRYRPNPTAALHDLLRSSCL